MKNNLIGKIAVFGAIPIALVWTFIDQASSSTSYENDTQNISAFMGRFIGNIFICMIIALIIAYIAKPRVKK